jgi:hypothetical protein
MYIGLNVKYLLFLSDINNCLIFSTDFLNYFNVFLVQTCFIKPHPLSEVLFHDDTRTDGRTDRHKDVNSPFSKFLVWFQWNLNFLERISKSHQIFTYKFCSADGQTERERDGYYEQNITHLVSHSKCAEHLQNNCEISDILTDSAVGITLLSVRLTCINTRSIGWHKCFAIGKTQFQIPSWTSMIVKLIGIFYVYSTYYVTTTSFLTFPLFYDVNIVMWSNEYCENKDNLGTVFMCELAGTVKP